MHPWLVEKKRGSVSWLTWIWINPSNGRLVASMCGKTSSEHAHWSIDWTLSQNKYTGVMIYVGAQEGRGKILQVRQAVIDMRESSVSLYNTGCSLPCASLPSHTHKQKSSKQLMTQSLYFLCFSLFFERKNWMEKKERNKQCQIAYHHTVSHACVHHENHFDARHARTERERENQTRIQLFMNTKEFTIQKNSLHNVFCFWEFIQIQIFRLSPKSSTFCWLYFVFLLKKMVTCLINSGCFPFLSFLLSVKIRSSACGKGRSSALSFEIDPFVTWKNEQRSCSYWTCVCVLSAFFSSSSIREQSCGRRRIRILIQCVSFRSDH